MAGSLAFFRSRKAAWESVGPLSNKGVEGALKENKAVAEKRVTASSFPPESTGDVCSAAD